MNDGRKARVVVRWNIAHALRLLSFSVEFRVDAADEPEHRGHMPFRSEASEVLAGRGRPAFLDPIREVLDQRAHYSMRILKIILPCAASMCKRNNPLTNKATTQVQIR